MERVKIQVTSLCCGSEEIDLFFNDHKISFHATYLGQEPLSSLIQAVYELEEEGIYDIDSDEVRYESDVRWLSEPGYLKIEFRKIENALNIHLTLADDFVDRAIMVEELRFSVPYKAFKEAVVFESLRILRQYGIKGYYKSWSAQRDFPLGMFLTLLGCRSKETELGIYISNLSTECKLLTECNL